MSDHRELLRLSLPLIASNLSVPLLGLVDTAVAGHLPLPTSLAAVATAAAVASVLLLGVNFLRTGTTGLTAQADGSGDHAEAQRVFLRAAMLALGISAVLVALRTPITTAGLALMDPPDGVLPEATAYLQVRLLAAPFGMMNLALAGWFLGLGRPAVAVAITVSTNLVNAAADVGLVWGLGWGVEGLAWATVAGEAAGMAVALPSIVLAMAGVDRSSLYDAEAWRRLIQVNRDLFIRTICLTSSFAFFTAQAGRFGEVALAANAVLMQLQGLMSYGLDGFAHAAEVLVGRALGQRDVQAVRRAVRVSLQWSGAVAVATALVYALFGNPLVAQLTDLSEVRAVVATLMPWMVASPLVSVWAFTFDGIYIGGTWSRTMRNSMLGAAFVYIAATFALRGLGHHGLWAAFLLFMAIRGLWLAAALPGRIATVSTSPAAG